MTNFADPLLDGKIDWSIFLIVAVKTLIVFGILDQHG